ncbi:uncharacterized protein LOC124533631 isoform X1 [Vanessa cardui]|uniref:uncharacterized protein LOC124533631 isoform X1 n=1 Tax=Vanessa cardui TaxID=171605 RepID=UPI001F129FA7|nr:uncharacterized protein LOC124533631 isoform X1 [Vanessa cardui]
MFLYLLILSVLNISLALPNGNIPQNVITVPPNCPEGQELINGQCRDIWKSGLTTPLPRSLIYGKNVTPMNMVTVPTNCPPGQQLINGQCRDVWKGALAKNVTPMNMVTVPTNCPPGQQLINGQCRDVWKGALAESRLFEMLLKSPLARSATHNNQISKREEHENGNENILESNDTLRNIISVPTQCPEGYRPDALGICRRIF